MGKSRHLVKAASGGDPASAFAAVTTATDRLEAMAKQAEAAGDHIRARDLRREAALVKFQVAEVGRQNDPSVINRRLNGQGVPLLKNSRELPDDRDCRYI